MEKRNIPVFVTEDGKEFTSEIEAIQHEAGLKAQARIDAYLASVNKELPPDDQMSARSMAMTRNIVMAWERWKAAQESLDNVAKIA